MEIFPAGAYVYAAVIVNCPPAANNPAIISIANCFTVIGVK